MVWLIPGQGMMSVSVRRFSLTIKDLLALGLNKVHTQCLSQVTCTFLSVCKVVRICGCKVQMIGSFRAGNREVKDSMAIVLNLFSILIIFRADILSV